MEQESGVPSYNQRALVRCDADYLGAAIPTLTTQPPAIILEPLAVICSGKKLPKIKQALSRVVRLHVFHSGIIIEILFGRRFGELVWYPIQNLYCSASILPMKTKHGTYVFKTLEESGSGKSNLRPVFAVVMRETVHKKVLQCHAFSVVNEELAKLLVRATAVAFKDKNGWNQPVTIDRFSESNFTYSLSEVDDDCPISNTLSSNHVSEIEVGVSESDSQSEIQSPAADNQSQSSTNQRPLTTSSSSSSSAAVEVSARNNHYQRAAGTASSAEQLHQKWMASGQPTQTLRHHHHQPHHWVTEHSVNGSPISNSHSASRQTPLLERINRPSVPSSSSGSSRLHYSHTNGHHNPPEDVLSLSGISNHQLQSINPRMNHPPSSMAPQGSTNRRAKGTTHSYFRQVPPEVLYDFSPPQLYPPGTIPPNADGMELVPVYHPEQFMYSSRYANPPHVIPAAVIPPVISWPRQYKVRI